MSAAPPPIINYATPGAKPQRKVGSLFGWVLFMGLAVMLFIVLQSNRKSYQDIPLSEFHELLESGSVQSIVVDREVIRGTIATPLPRPPGSTLPPSNKFRTELPTTAVGWPFMQWLLEHSKGAEIRVENNANLLVDTLVPMIPWLLIFFFIWFFVFRQLRKNTAVVHTPVPQPVYIVQPPEPK